MMTAVTPSRADESALPEALVAGRAIWARLAALAAGEQPPPVDGGGRMAPVTGAAFAAWATGRSDLPGAAESRLYQRLRRVTALRLAVAAGQAGHDVICLKGTATAALLYPEPDARPMADLDLLAPQSGLLALVEWLHGQGFRFAPRRSRAPWGLIGDASFRPLLASDGTLNLDLHIEPDAWPLHRGLDAAAVRLASRPCETEAGTIRIPSPSHLLLLAASHAGRDLFATDTFKNLVDGLFLVAGRAGPLDWTEIERRAGAGLVRRPLRVFRGLLATLAGAPAADPFVGSLAESFLRFDPAARTLELPWVAKLGREWRGSDPGIPLHRLGQRLYGLARPWDGLPAGFAGPQDA